MMPTQTLFLVEQLGLAGLLPQCDIVQHDSSVADGPPKHLECTRPGSKQWTQNSWYLRRCNASSTKSPLFAPTSKTQTRQSIAVDRFRESEKNRRFSAQGEAATAPNSLKKL